MSMPEPIFAQVRSTSTTQKESVIRSVFTAVIIVAGFIVGLIHLIALPLVIAADKSFPARVERKQRREAMKAGRRIANRERFGVEDPMARL